MSAPVKSRLGRVEWGNAVIVGVEDRDMVEYEDIRVRVAFSHPTESRLVACKYYLEGRCTREEGERSCKWSHGEIVRLGEVRAWKDADYSNVREGCEVLVRGEQGVWERGKVEEVCLGEFLIKLFKAGSEPVSKSIEEIFPLDTETSEKEDDICVENVDNLDDSFVPSEIGSSGVNFGEWESHTRGLGSSLMVKMGWVVGQGLGKAGEGRVEPVTARVYPVGKSLDWCMERREMMGGGDVLDVENILKKEAKDAERKSKKRAEDEYKRDNVAKSLFDFINTKLGNPGNDGRNNSFKSKNSFSNNKNKTNPSKATSDSSLKIRQFKNSEQISKVEKEITRLKESYSRHQGKDAKTAAGIKLKMEEKISELRSLEAKDKSLKLEEGSRKSKSKLTIF